MATIDQQRRHDNMAAIHSKNTQPELIVRKYLFAHGFRYRLNHKRLPGHPDIVMRKYRTCIFVNGCFWHGHEGCRYFTMPKTNTDFWQKKISRNQQRDRIQIRKLTEMGWHCITLWECELKPKCRLETLTALEYTLNSIFLKNQTKPYLPIQNDIQMVADDIHLPDEE